MLRKFRIVIASVVTIAVSVVASLAANHAVSAARPESLRPAGTTRYAVASAKDLVSTTSAAGWVDVPGLSQSITIPTGNSGDVFILFCGSSFVDHDSADLFARAMVGGIVAGPGSVTLYDGPIAVVSECANFNRLNVAAGTTTVKIQWYESIPTVTAYLWYYRSMLVTVNIH